MATVDMEVAEEALFSSIDKYTADLLGLPLDQYVDMYSKTDVSTACEMYKHGMSTIFAPLIVIRMAGLDQTAKLREQYPEIFV